MEFTGLDLGLLPDLCAPKQVDKAFLQVGSSDWDVTLEAVDLQWGTLVAPPKGTENRAICGQPGCCGLSCSHPHPTRGPSSSLGPEGAAFSGPPPPGNTWARAMGLHGT